jgi:hypothetical protein
MEASHPDIESTASWIDKEEGSEQNGREKGKKKGKRKQRHRTHQ